MIKYFLYLNKLTADPNDYAARVVDVKPYYLEDVVKIMIREGKSLTEEGAVSYYIALEKALQEIIENGGSIHLSILNTSYSIKGVFYDEEEPLTEDNHSFKVKAHPGEVLTTAAKKVKLKRIQPSEYAPKPRKLTDIGSGAANELLTPGNMACLKGEQLSINVQDAEEGLYLIDANNEEFKIEHIARNMPSELVFLLPQELAAGTYALEVRNRGYKVISTGRLKHPLTVQ